MVKKCAVKNCMSGSIAERKRKLKQNDRPTASFHVPKCPSMLQKWNLALSQQLLPKNFVCELHFKEEDIHKKFDSIILPNGDIYDLSKARFDLKVGAIPVIVNNTTDVNMLQCSENTNISTHVNSEQMIVDEEDITIAEDQQHEKNDVSNNLSESSEQISSSRIIDGVTADPNCIEATELTEQTSSDENIFQAPTIDNSETFSLSAIIQALEDRGVPQNWCWSKQLEPQKVLILYYVDIILKLVKLEIKISRDLTLQVTVIKTGVSVNLDNPLTSTENFWKMLQDIEKSQFCTGAGVNNRRCSATCNGILKSPDKYKRYRQINRCLACRKLRKRLLKLSIKKKSDLNNRFITIKRKLNSKQKRVHRLQQKSQKLKEELEDLRNRCAMTKENIIEEEIADLPEAQKQAVRACFQAAKAKNAKQRRYTIECVYECLMIRIKGPSVYEKLRQREILPLPSKDTLNRYINKLDSAFGFPRAIFDTLRLKASRMENWAKRGIIKGV